MSVDDTFFIVGQYITWSVNFAIYRTLNRNKFFFIKIQEWSTLSKDINLRHFHLKPCWYLSISYEVIKNQSLLALDKNWYVKKICDKLLFFAMNNCWIQIILSIAKNPGLNDRGNGSLFQALFWIFCRKFFIENFFAKMKI